MRALREDLLNLLADLEAGLDFTDEDIHFVSLDDLLELVSEGLSGLSGAISGARSREQEIRR